MESWNSGFGAGFHLSKLLVKSNSTAKEKYGILALEAFLLCLHSF